MGSWSGIFVQQRSRFDWLQLSRVWLLFHFDYLKFSKVPSDHIETGCSTSIIDLYPVGVCILALTWFQHKGIVLVIWVHSHCSVLQKKVFKASTDGQQSHDGLLLYTNKPVIVDLESDGSNVG